MGLVGSWSGHRRPRRRRHSWLRNCEAVLLWARLLWPVLALGRGPLGSALGAGLLNSDQKSRTPLGAGRAGKFNELSTRRKRCHDAELSLGDAPVFAVR